MVRSPWASLGGRQGAVGVGRVRRRCRFKMSAHMLNDANRLRNDARLWVQLCIHGCVCRFSFEANK